MSDRIACAAPDCSETACRGGSFCPAHHRTDGRPSALQIALDRFSAKNEGPSADAFVAAMRESFK